MNRKIVVADVGCRWGFSDMWAPLAGDVRLFGFDPDPVECDRLSAREPSNPDLRFVAKALGAMQGQQKIYVTREPACSSLYRPDARLTSNLPDLACATEERVETVDMTTLDAWCQAESEPVVDFIKLDVQGAELDVLRGAEVTLRTVRALELEVEFNPIYTGQPLFGDVDAFLRARGFQLWRLGNLVHYSDHRFNQIAPKPDTFYYDSRPLAVTPMAGQLYWGHAYYVCNSMLSTEPPDDPEQTSRDAALMEVLGFLDLATWLRAR